MSQLHVLYVNSIDVSEVELKERVKRAGLFISHKMMEAGDSRIPVLTTGREDYKLYCPHGDWNKWYSSTLSRYDVYLVDSMRVGKGTADLLTRALKAKKALRIYTGGQTKTIKAVKALDIEDWKAGWLVIT